MTIIIYKKQTVFFFDNMQYFFFDNLRPWRLDPKMAVFKQYTEITDFETLDPKMAIFR